MRVRGTQIALAAVGKQNKNCTLWRLIVELHA
jgi:hypothetical protein